MIQSFCSLPHLISAIYSSILPLHVINAVQRRLWSNKFRLPMETADQGYLERKSCQSSRAFWYVSCSVCSISSSILSSTRVSEFQILGSYTNFVVPKQLRWRTRTTSAWHKQCPKVTSIKKMMYLCTILLLERPLCFNFFF